MNKISENKGGSARADGDLFGDETGELGGDQQGDGETGDQARGPGRPKGALNRKTKDLYRYLAQTVDGFTDPAVVLARAASAKVTDIAKDLKCSNQDAMALKLSAADKLMPYLHGKAPAQEVGEDERIPMLIVDTGIDQLTEQRQVGVYGEQDQPLMIAAEPEPETAENRHSETADDGRSHDSKSHEKAK